MRNFQDTTFEKCKRQFISAFSVCMTVSLSCLGAKVLFEYHIQIFSFKLTEAAATRGVLR